MLLNNKIAEFFKDFVTKIKKIRENKFPLNYFHCFIHSKTSSLKANIKFNNET